MDVLEMGSSWNFSARASSSCEVSEPSRAELGHFNFRAETELTILTICMSKNSKRLTHFPTLLLYHDSNQFHDHLSEFISTKGVFLELNDMIELHNLVIFNTVQCIVKIVKK